MDGGPVNLRSRLAPPKISVLMGAYNCADTIVAAITCIQAQTYQDWEIIVCDDASQDETLQILKDLASRDRRILVIANEVNLGLAPSLNRCLDRARGELIARMDGDDLCSPSRFELQVRHLNTHESLPFVSTAMLLFDENGVWGKTRPAAAPVSTGLLSGTPFAHAPVVMRREVLLAVGGYSEADGHRRVEDKHLWLKMFENGYRGESLAEPLYYMRSERAAAARRQPYLGSNLPQFFEGGVAL